MPGFIGLPEILLLGLVVLIIFGPKRLPEMGRSLGHGFREFKDSITGDKTDDHDRFAVPTQEPEIALLASAEEPPAAAVPSPRAVATVLPAERALSRVTPEDQRVA
jgi:sec-independent protein translocase protein TatA